MNATALILVDMLNRYEHEDAEPLTESVAAALPSIVRLLEQARSEERLLIYVNDNHGEWGAARRELTDWALTGAEPELVRPIIPRSGEPFIAKARHSIFYETQLDYMLRSLEVERIVLAGQVTEQCILYSALDAYIRHYSVVVPADAVAHIHGDLADAALRMMELNMRAEITTVSACELG